MVLNGYLAVGEGEGFAGWNGLFATTWPPAKSSGRAHLEDREGKGYGFATVCAVSRARGSLSRVIGANRRPRAPSFLGQEPIVHIPAGAATSSRTSKTRILGGEKAPATLGRAAAPLKSRAALTRRGAPGRAVGLGQSVQPCGATVGLAQLSQDQREQNSGDESDQRDSEFRIHRWLPAR